MKKILSIVLVAMLSLALLVSLVGCFSGSTTKESGLERAQKYLDQIMNNKSANTAADYDDLLTNVVIDKENYPVTWAVTAEDGSKRLIRRTKLLPMCPDAPVMTYCATHNPPFRGQYITFSNRMQKMYKYS